MATGDMEGKPVWLDYGGAERTEELIANLSGVAAAGEYLWTVSDEGRSIECLASHRSGYRLRKQYGLDELFEVIPGAETGDEADIESIDVARDRLWICGSHCRVRRQIKKTGNTKVDPRFRSRPSRRLLGAVRLSADGGELLPPGECLPFGGKGSLRKVLGESPFIEPFIDLPSKENGLDIEGVAIHRRRILVGLRGPVVDSIGLVAELEDADELSPSGLDFLHFVDLAGLGVRDLARWNSGILILAGPVSAAEGPFRLYQWQPRRTAHVQKPEAIHEFGDGPGGPEGICALTRGGRDGLLVVYDTRDPKRINGARYRADWMVPPSPD